MIPRFITVLLKTAVMFFVWITVIHLTTMLPCQLDVSPQRIGGYGVKMYVDKHLEPLDDVHEKPKFSIDMTRVNYRIGMQRAAGRAK